MKNFRIYIFALLAVIFGAVSCTDTVKQEELVPEGVLKIFADKTSIAADGVDCVTFRVMFGSKDVSQEKTMKIVYTVAGKNAEMSAGANTFSTAAPGEYVFKATLYSGGNHTSENEIKVTAAEVAGQKSYFQKVIGEQFTSVGCVNCPSLSLNIKEVQAQMPGVLIPLSFHMDYNMADPMTIEATGLFYKAYGMSGLPYFNINMRKQEGGVSREPAGMISAIEDELEMYPATCGVAIETSYDSAAGKVTVTSKITSNVAARHKYHIFLLEDGISATQSGANGDYIHNNVVRKMFAPDITGMNINKKNPFTPGVEVTAVNSVELEKGWNPDNMRVVVIAMTTADGGVTFNCNNANECPLGGSADYILNK